MYADKKGSVIQQFAEEVLGFSSQYGSETSISYTVPNLGGESTIYPKYGDYTQACVFRMYGPWWKTAPSAPRILHRTPPTFLSEDYVDIKFGTAVFPTKVEIFETYNPGAVVRILATNGHPDRMDGDIRWRTLWSGKNERAPAKSRIFCPKIKAIPFPTQVLRLELNHDLCEYYTELDAVRLTGFPIDATDGTQVDDVEDDEDDEFHDAIGNSPEKLTDELLRLRIQDGESAAHHSDNGFFDFLPEEVIQVILSYLDHQSLCKLAATCRLIHTHCYDSLQYTDLNLQPYWAQVRDETLDKLSARCRHMQRLSLSWCGAFSALSSACVNKFLSACGTDLTCLRIASCQVVAAGTLHVVADSCPNLTELDLHSNRNIAAAGFVHLTKLEKLESLNLYRTSIDVHSLISVIRSCPELAHLNIGACNLVNNFDDVATELSTHCKKLKSLDVWRARTMTDVGLCSLADGCPLLQELDLGWCIELRSSSQCFVELVRKCPNIKKLFFTANRTVCDRDLNEIANRCPQLEQLDILGTREVTETVAQRVLERCKKLVFFDVSFCAGIEFATVRFWKEQYPHVSIKKSFQDS